MNIMLIGQGGHSKVVRDIILEKKEYQLVGYLDDKYQTLTLSNNGYVGPIHSAWEMIGKITELKFVIAIGNNKIRKQIYETLQLPDHYYLSLIHKSAVLSPSAKIGAGTVVMANVVINADSVVGNHTILNTASIVEHDNIVGDFVHLSPNVTLTGAVKVGEGAHLGAASTLIPNIEVGEWTVIGAGASVIHNIPPYCTAVGVPAKVKGKNTSNVKAI